MSWDSTCSTAAWIQMSWADPPFVKMLICSKVDSANQTPGSGVPEVNLWPPSRYGRACVFLFFRGACHWVQTHQSTHSVGAASGRLLSRRASPPVTCQIREKCYFVSDTRERQLDCLQAVISGARCASMFLADDNYPAVPERTKQSRKRFIIVYVWLNNGSTTPAAQALVHRQPAGGGGHAAWTAEGSLSVKYLNWLKSQPQ